MSNITQYFDILMGITIPQILIIKDNTQKTISCTWQTIFDYIKSKHWHSEGGKITPHSESLYDHLLSVGDISYTHAKNIGYNDHDCIKAFLTGLLHDIGKPGTMTFMGKHVAFKGHGLNGGAMIENFWSPEIEDKLGMTASDWGDISTCADVHMCGYFPTQKTDDHKFSLNILPSSVKSMLIPLRRGDQLGLVPYPDGIPIQTILEQLDSSEDDFVNCLMQDMNVSDYISSTNKAKGILIQVQGGSADGKTTFARKLKNFFGDKAVYLNRDFFMVNRSRHEMRLPPVTMEEITPSIYTAAYDAYIASDKKWASLINKDIYNGVLVGLHSGKIVITDSMITMFDKAVFSVIPNVALSAYKINFWLHRNVEVTVSETENRLGMDLDTQLKAHGNIDIYTPLREGINWINLISHTEKSDMSEQLPYQAHLSISVGWTGIKEHIISHLCNKINDIYNCGVALFPRMPSIEETMNMTLIELVHLLRDRQVINIFFETYNYRVLTKRISPKIIGVQYMDGINQIWRPKWAREARGRFYDISGPTIIELKSGLSRGIEILTIAHTENDVSETSDLDTKSYEHLDDTQQMLMKKFSGSNPLNTWITAKVDGSLAMINIYPPQSPQYPIMCKTVEKYGDEFAKKLYYYCRDNAAPIITVSSKGTLLMGVDMQDYFQTALQPLIPCYQNWEEAIPYFVSLVMDYYGELVRTFKDNSKFNPDGYITLTFEAYCKDRTTYLGNRHSELAVSYNENGMNLLGMVHNNHYFPHFDLPKKVFKQPFAKLVRSTNEVFDIMDKLDKMVCGEISQEDFLSNFILDEMDSRLVHPEGFVILTPLEDGTYDYAKIKTNMYYKCHKVRERYIPYLRSLPVASHIHYPIVKGLIEYFDNMKPNLENLVKESYLFLSKEIDKTSPCYNAFKENTNETNMASLSNTAIKKNKGALIRFDNYLANPTEKDKDIIIKMLMNSTETRQIINQKLLTITKLFFEVREEKEEDFVLFTRKLIMAVTPWNDGWEDTLKKFIDSGGEIINRLYGLVFN
jgi:hypothetical protein